MQLHQQSFFRLSPVYLIFRWNWRAKHLSGWRVTWFYGQRRKRPREERKEWKRAKFCPTFHQKTHRQLNCGFDGLLIPCVTQRRPKNAPRPLLYPADIPGLMLPLCGASLSILPPKRLEVGLCTFMCNICEVWAGDLLSLPRGELDWTKGNKVSWTFSSLVA